MERGKVKHSALQPHLNVSPKNTQDWEEEWRLIFHRADMMNVAATWQQVRDAPLTPTELHNYMFHHCCETSAVIFEKHAAFEWTVTNADSQKCGSHDCSILKATMYCSDFRTPPLLSQYQISKVILHDSCEITLTKKAISGLLLWNAREPGAKRVLLTR